MNQADILKMAESSGLITSQHGGICTRMTREYITPELTRFAELVAQHERERIASPLTQEEMRQVLECLKMGLAATMYVHGTESKNKDFIKEVYLEREEKIESAIALLKGMK